MNAANNFYHKLAPEAGILLAALMPLSALPAAGAPPRKAHWVSVSRKVHHAAPKRVAQNGVPRGAFIRLPVHSVAELVTQVRTDPIVSRRFTRLFNMSPQMVLLAFGDLHMTRTNTELVRKVYYAHTGEVIGYRVRRIKKGTDIFAYPDGTPILLAVCGNAVRPNKTAAAVSAQPKIPYFTAAEEEIAPSKTVPGSYYPSRSMTPEAPIAARETPPLPDFVVESDAVAYNRPARSFHESLPVSELRGIAGGGLIGWVAGTAVLGSLAGSHFGSGGSPSAAAEGGSGSGTVININNANNSNSNSHSGNNGGINGGHTNGGNSVENDNGGNINGGDHSVVPENNSMLLFLFAGGGCLAFMAAKRRFARA